MIQLCHYKSLLFFLALTSIQLTFFLMLSLGLVCSRPPYFLLWAITFSTSFCLGHLSRARKPANLFFISSSSATVHFFLVKLAFFFLLVLTRISSSSSSNRFGMNTSSLSKNLSSFSSTSFVSSGSSINSLPS